MKNFKALNLAILMTMSFAGNIFAPNAQQSNYQIPYRIYAIQAPTLFYSLPMALIPIQFQPNGTPQSTYNGNEIDRMIGDNFVPSAAQDNSRTMPQNATASDGIIAEILQEEPLTPTYSAPQQNLSAEALEQHSTNWANSTRAAPSMRREAAAQRQTQEANEAQECTICQEPMEGTVTSIQGCKHLYHRHCIEQWFNTNQSCPLCRGTANDQTLLKVNLSQPQPQRQAQPRRQAESRRQAEEDLRHVQEPRRQIEALRQTEDEYSCGCFSGIIEWWRNFRQGR